MFYLNLTLKSLLPNLSDLGSSIDLLGIIDGAFTDVFGISISDFIQSILGFFDLGDLGGVDIDGSLVFIAPFKNEMIFSNS
ncbi:hypothetical protein CEXT_531711 [Caerostris extrusa]|uniref:Uncharacterized protein n=1 Tax=Caerostris extrusa TaxID=172846 RepID=A0AAV4T140_CAEEX|nr:hypothetical protein CEXT_531711 [Caerostris extrusa]